MEMDNSNNNIQDNSDGHIKSMEEDLNRRLGRILDDIENMRMVIIDEPLQIKYYGEKVHMFFMNLSRKMGTDDIKQQEEWNKEQNNLKPIIQCAVNGRGFKCKPYLTIRPDELKKYLDILEKRERHLYNLIDRLETKRRVV